MTAVQLGYPALVADIGGSNARMAWLAAPGAAFTHVKTLTVAAHAGPAEAMHSYLQAHGLPMPQRAAFAVATPAHEDKISFTNSPWAFSRRALAQQLGLRDLLVLNDFEALALSLPWLRPEQLRVHGELPVARGCMAVIGPGTGLGVSAVVQTPQGWLALPGEGGHATLAPSDELESAVLAVLRERYEHVSAERLLSGVGLPLLYQALAQVRGQSPLPLDTATIVARGLARSDALCEEVLELFCALLGSFAGNVALVLGSRGGVFIGGGIVPRMAERFFASRFRARFEAKGRFTHYLSEIPTALIVDTMAALTGVRFKLSESDGCSLAT